MMDYIFIGLFIVVILIMMLRALLMKDALRYFKRIKDESPDLYQVILGGRENSWIERGYHLPSDMGVQVRLYKVLYRGLADKVLNGDKLSAFKNKLHVLIFLLMIFIILATVFSIQVIL